MSDKAISEIFDVEPQPRTEIIVPVVNQAEEVDHDAAYASNNIRKLIELGMCAVEDAATVAKDSESPRAYEVVQTMIKSLTDMNLQLMDLHSKRKDLNAATDSKQNTQQNVTNNAFFVGTTKDLNELINKRLANNVK